MRRMCFFVILIAVFIAGNVLAETYTLEQCIEMAFSHDPSLISQRNSVSLAKATVWEQAGNFLPSASLSYRAAETKYGPSRRTEFVGGVPIEQTDSVTAITKNYSAGIDLNMTLFDGLRNIWNYKGSRASLEQSRMSFAQGKSDLTFSVKTSYYLVLKAKNDFEVAQDAVKRSDELLKLFQEKYELGSASKSEVLKQKVQYGNDQLTLVRAQNALQVAYDNLAILVGLDPVENFEIEEIELRRESVEDVGEFIRRATEFHPIIQESQAAMNAYRYDVRSAWGWYMPTLNLSFGHGWGNNKAGELFTDVGDFNNYNYSTSWSLLFSFNIFDGFTRERNLKRARLGLNNARANFFYQRNWVIKNIEDAYLGVKLAVETLSVTEETERAASEDMDLVQAKYNLGAAALWELLDAQVSLKDAQFKKVAAEFDYNLAQAKLKNAMGE